MLQRVTEHRQFAIKLFMGVACSIMGCMVAYRLTAQGVVAPLTPAAELPAPAPAAVEQPILQAYPVGTGDPQAIIQKIQTQLPRDANVSLAADVRTGRVLVLAPPGTQPLVAQLIGQAQPAPAASAANVAGPQLENNAAANPAVDPAPGVASAPAPANSPAADFGPRSEQVIKLQHLSGAEFEQALITLVARQLPVSTDPTNSVATYTLSGRGGNPTLVSVNRTTGQLTIAGADKLVQAWGRVFTALDRPAQAAGKDDSRVVPIRNPDALANGSLQRAMSIISEQVANGDRAAPQANRFVSMLFQPKEQPAANPANPNNSPDPNDPNAANPAANAQNPANPTPALQNPFAQPNANPATAENPDDDLSSGLIGPVRIEFIEGLDLLVITGNPRDVERVQRIIAEIEERSKETIPVVVLHPLKFVSSDAMATLVRSLYDQVLSPRAGRVSITSLVKPNSLLLIGRKESIEEVVKLIEKLDQPVEPNTQFKVFELKHTAATEVLQTVQSFLGGTATGPGAAGQTGQPATTASITGTGLGTRAVVTADYRTNALIVRASLRDLEEIEALIKRIDVQSSSAINEVRVFNLKYSLAEELAPVLQTAINGQQTQNRTQQNQGGNQNQGGGNPFQQFQQQPGGQNQQGNQQQQRAIRSTMLQFFTIDDEGKKQLKSGILTDVRIVADGRNNSLLVTAPAESMELIQALIKELDQVPTAEAQIKVFQIENGDATALVTMLQNLFGIQATNTQRGGAAFNFAQNTGDTSGDNPLVNLRFSVDQRTNSIIATGSSGDLNVVEAILLRLDESDIRQRKSTVYRLKNAPAQDVANAITQLLNSERQLTQQVGANLVSAFEQIEREVVVVPEPVSNSLIISATPRYFDEVKRIVEEIDQRPPMVMIQVMIAEVDLNNYDEFGVEVGVQDSVLFDRSLLGDLVTTTTTTTFGNPATTVQQQNVLAATNAPGFAFNNQQLGNSGSSQAIGKSSTVGTQGLTSFNVGRVNNELGFGGLVLSASSESLSFLLRALSQKRRVEVLSRPQIMTLDNQEAYIQVGQRVPRINAVNVAVTGQQTNSITLENVGLIMRVLPRISPDGLIVMSIAAEKSELGPEADGIPIFIDNAGQVVRSPRINTILAETVVSAANAQTVILGGLIVKNKQQFSRRAPFLSDIPILGHLFRYDSNIMRRSELLIILTPRVVRTQADAELIKQVEASRMSWCLADVIRINGPSGLRGRKDEWLDAETVVVYPDLNPHGENQVLFPDEFSPGVMGGETLPPGAVLSPGSAAGAGSPTLAPGTVVTPGTEFAPGTIIAPSPVPGPGGVILPGGTPAGGNGVQPPTNVPPPAPVPGVPLPNGGTSPTTPRGTGVVIPAGNPATAESNGAKTTTATPDVPDPAGEKSTAKKGLLQLWTR
ncbi:MAG: secretin N-terminal domain-containing protein [Pirellulales bacterium]|nr:secretin N-terminal domain-containing protein [Pirellulales bacterium]